MSSTTSSTLADQQLLQGLPIQTGEDTLDSTKFLSSLTTSVGATVPPSEYFLRSPVLTWQGCVSAKGSGPPPPHAAAAPGRPVVDLETQAAAIIGPTRRLFADVSQGTVNMCTSLAFAQAYTLKYCLQHTPEDFKDPAATVPQLSAVFAYYFQRVEECRTFGVCKCTLCAQRDTCTDVCNPPCIDCGSYLLSAATVFANGVCISACWPYSKVQTGDLNTPPDVQARENALAFRIPALSCIAGDAATAYNMVRALAQGQPVVVFVNLTPAQVAWMQAQQLPSSGDPADLIMPEYVPGPTSALVGHAVLVDGYVAASDVFLVRNNFGLAWGSKGRFAMRASAFTTPGQLHSAVELTRVCGPRPIAVTPEATAATQPGCPALTSSTGIVAASSASTAPEPTP